MTGKLSARWNFQKIISGLPPYAARMMDGLGFRYLLLHRVSEAPGMLMADELAAA